MAGPRLLECCRLRIKDLDFATNHITIRDGKDGRDRMTMFPGVVKADLAKHFERVRALHQRDLRQGAGWVELPWALARKYPNAGREWAGQWLFPATRFSVDRATGQRRRHHLHESVIQRAVTEAVLKTGTAKKATCHTFRHSLATHLLEDGHTRSRNCAAIGLSLLSRLVDTAKRVRQVRIGTVNRMPKIMLSL